MESRGLYPRSPVSSASALDSANNSIRHRLSPRIPQGSDYDPSDCQAGATPPASNAEDDAHLQSSVFVRSNAHVASSSPVLPFAGPSTTHLPEIRESTSFSEIVLLEAVPLTPRPDLLQERTKSTATHESRLSRLSRMSTLPSPDFFAPPLRSSLNSFAGIFDYFKGPGSETRPKPSHQESQSQDTMASTTGRYVAGLRDSAASSLRSMRSMRVPSLNRLKSHIRTPSLRLPNFASQPLESRSQTRSTVSSHWTSSSARTYASTSSVDSGRTYLFPGISTTDRFTHRWPTPTNLKKLERRSTIEATNDFSSVTSQELSSGSYDVGLGFEYVGRWTTHKWLLFLSVLSVLGYSAAALIYTILTWYQTWDHSDVMLVADGDVLILATLCACLLLLAALVGLTGTLLNSRPLLAIYALLLWPAFISLLSVGYVSYKRASFSLDRKLNMAWSKWYTDAGRAVIQDGLRCCGFSDPTHEAVYAPGFAGGCYPRTHRPGCKGPLLRFERENLGSLWRAAFSAAPLHIINIIVSMLCANHVTRTFGTGLLPRGYRLQLTDVRADAKNLLEHFASEKDGATRLPPLMARTESGMRWRREDRVHAYDYVPERLRED